MENTSGILPLEKNILVKVDGQAEKIGSIHIATSKSKQEIAINQYKGTVVALGPRTYESQPAFKSRPGDTAVFPRGAGLFVEGEDGEFYRLLSDEQVMGVIRKGSPPNG